MAKDLYAVLGVTKGASADDIKKAYRRMSKEWHPDKHKGDKDVEHKFKEINEAYEVLSDPKKKQMYDQFGTTGNGGSAGAGSGGFDFSGFNTGGGFGDFADIFENFFGEGDYRQIVLRLKEEKKGPKDGEELSPVFADDGLENLDI